MKKIMQLIMLSCKKATELIEKKLLTKLSFREKVQLKMHKSLCDACTAYEKQSKLMDELLSKHIHNYGDNIKNEGIVENEELKKKILESIK
ncbi:MAG: hypothetical protein KGM16_07140 [Bacteroidota bacterium]|nr:hypothetical protein [Bacteroidota bacterium]